MIYRLACGFSLAATLATANPVRSGHATAEWITETTTAEPGGLLRTAIRLTIDPSWHTYWINPGEAGVPTSVDWKLPSGWEVKSFTHPQPKRFLTGELVGFGHESVALFPVEIAVPENFQGITQLNGTVSWLSCNAEACVPGEVPIMLQVTAGKPSATPNADAIAKAFAAIPQTENLGLSLRVAEVDDQWQFTIQGQSPWDFGSVTTFVENPDIIDPTAQVIWKKDRDDWTARVPKSPYPPDSLEQLSVLLVSPAAPRPLRLQWQKNQAQGKNP